MMAENGLTPLERIMKRVTVNEDGCWIWSGSIEKNGYGRMNVNGKRTMVHRAAYELQKGEQIPEGMTVDHLCFVRNCVNVDHMEIVTRGENSRRSGHPTMRSARENVCKRGHALVGDNVYFHPKRNTRHCKECQRMRGRKLREAKAAEIGKPEREYENVPAPPKYVPEPTKEPAAPTHTPEKEPVPA